MTRHWQVQEAKQRFSELLREAITNGPQYVSKHGEDVAVLIDLAEYRRLKGETKSFKEFLMSAPDLDELDIQRSAVPTRTVEFGD